MTSLARPVVHELRCWRARWAIALRLTGRVRIPLGPPRNDNAWSLPERYEAMLLWFADR